MNLAIKELKELILFINSKHSGLYPGQFKDEGTFEAIISKVNTMKMS